MSVKELDYFFPFIVTAYGLIITVLFQSGLVNLAAGRIPEQMIQRLKGNRILGLFCLIIGSAWSLQNLLFS